MSKIPRRAIVLIAAICGSQLVSVVTWSLAGDSTQDCYHLGDVNRWAERTGYNLRFALENPGFVSRNETSVVPFHPVRRAMAAAPGVAAAATVPGTSQRYASPPPAPLGLTVNGLTQAQYRARYEQLRARSLQWSERL